MRAQKEIRRIVEKASIYIRENIYCHKKLIKDVSGEILDENEKHVIGNWRKVIFIIKWQGTRMNCVLVLGGK